MLMTADETSNQTCLCLCVEVVGYVFGSVVVLVCLLVVVFDREECRQGLIG